MLPAFLWDQPVLEGEGEAPLVLPAVGSVGACGELCVGRLWERHRWKYLGWKKNVAVFSEAAPRPAL